jgi:hypothetical protein
VEEKHKDLNNTKQKAMIKKIMATLSNDHPSFYYLSTSEVAHEIKNHIDTAGKLSKDEFDLLKNLDHRDIQMLLSLH